MKNTPKNTIHVSVEQNSFTNMENPKTGKIQIVKASNNSMNLDPKALEGKIYLQEVIARAKYELSHVYSRADKSKLAIDMVSDDTLFKIVIIEHSSEKELRQNPKKAMSLVLYELADKKGAAYANDISSASAHGLVQLIPSTYKHVRNRYPEAKLISNFSRGSRDHVNAVKAAILECDDAMMQAQVFSKKSIMSVSDQRRQEFILTAYNGGPFKATKILFSEKDFSENKIEETRGYINKARNVPVVM